MNKELRCYTFTHFMLSSIQQGIQAGHASMEIVNKYLVERDLVERGWVDGYAEQVNDWIANHKTIVCLNGGNSDGVREIKTFLDNANNPFPYAGFFEDEQSLNGALTSVAIVLPERIFNTATLMRSRTLPNGVSYTYDKLLSENRFAFEGPNFDNIQLEIYTEWEYELMQKLNSCSLAR